jgi:hypothetical protein
MPQAWNLLDHLRRQTGDPILTAVLDGGFGGGVHPDLTGLTVAAIAGMREDYHGTHVAGTIGATWGNTTATGHSFGISGGNPMVQLVGVPMGPIAGGTADAVMAKAMGCSRMVDDFGRTILGLDRPPRVVNISLGMNWGALATWTNPTTKKVIPVLGLNPNTGRICRGDPVHRKLTYEEKPQVATAIQRIMETTGRLVHKILEAAEVGRGPVLVCTSTGNDSGTPFTSTAVFENGKPPVYTHMDSQLNSPFCWAALHLTPSIVTVENIDVTGFLHLSSNEGGRVSAPGTDILSTVVLRPDPSSAPVAGYKSESGTSMASPHVAALASYLAALDPSITNTELHDLLAGMTHPNRPQTTNAAPTVDAWQSVMAIDVLRGNKRIQTALCNVDDGTVHGNDPRLPGEDDGHGGTGYGVPYDVHGDPDSRITMADFRRFRDAYYVAVSRYPVEQLETLNEAIRPEQLENLKLKILDINRNGFLPDGSISDVADNENLYPRFDFNGDAKLSLGATCRVNDRLGEVTDLGVLQDVWPADGDEGWKAGDLELLMESGDIELHADDLLAAVPFGEHLHVQFAAEGRRADAPARVISRYGQRPMVTLPIAPESPGVPAVTQPWNVYVWQEAGRGRMLGQYQVTVRLAGLRVLSCTPALTGFSPTRGFAANPAAPEPFAAFAGTPVKVTGYGLDPDTDRIVFDTPGGEAVTLWGDDEELHVLVPQAAEDSIVEVHRSEEVLEATGYAPGVFHVLGPPEITRLAPTFGPVGIDILIVGSNFGDALSTVAVRFTGEDRSEVPASVRRVSNEAVVATVPYNAAPGDVYLITPAGRVKAGTFTPTADLGGGATIWVNTSLDEDALPRHLTLREAILIATGQFHGELIDDDDEDDNYDIPATLEEADLVQCPGMEPGTCGPNQLGETRRDTIRFLDPPGRDGMAITLTSALPPLSSGGDRIYGSRMDPDDDSVIYKIDPARIVVDGSAIAGSGKPGLVISSPQNDVRIGFTNFGNCGVLIDNATDNSLVGVLSRNNNPLEAAGAGIVIRGGGSNLIDDCVIRDNLGEGVLMTDGTVLNTVRGCIISGNTWGIRIEGEGTAGNTTSANDIGVGVISTAAEEHEIGPGNTAGGVLVENNACHNRITYDRIAGNSGVGLRVRGIETCHTYIGGDESPTGQTDAFIGGKGTTPSGVSLGNLGPGIDVSDGAADTRIVNCSILGNTGDGIRITDATVRNVTIESCKIGFVSADFSAVDTEGNGGHGIYVKGNMLSAPYGVKVLPHTIITSNGGYGILIQDVVGDVNNVLELRTPLNVGYKPGSLGGFGPIAPPHGNGGIRIERSAYVRIMEGEMDMFTDPIMAGETHGLMILNSHHVDINHYYVGRSRKTGITVLNSRQCRFAGLRGVHGEADGWVLAGVEDIIFQATTDRWGWRFLGAGAHNDACGMIIGAGCTMLDMTGMSFHDNGQGSRERAEGHGLVVDASFVPAGDALPPDYELYLASSETGKIRIAECEVGLEVGFTPAANRGSGIVVRGGCTDIAIGDQETHIGNMICTNRGHGVLIEGSDTRRISVVGSLIGDLPPDLSGPHRVALYGNQKDGVHIEEANVVSVGGGGAGRNTISGNRYNGINVNRGTDIRLLNNVVGLNTTATELMGNTLNGILIENSLDVVVGEPPDLGNAASGNLQNGILLRGNALARIVVSGNLIGTDADGNGAFANRASGIRVDGESAGEGDNLVLTDATRCTIGPGNVSSCNLDAGLLVENVTGLHVIGNTFGEYQQTGTLGNAGNGITLGNGAHQTRVERNGIFGNFGTGVELLPGSSHNTLRSNRIGSNGGEGIDGGMTFTVPPVRFRAVATGYIIGTLNNVTANGGTIELFATADDEGEIPLGLGTVSANQFGFKVYVPDGMSVTATITLPNGTTSSFSEPWPVVR